MRKEAEQQTETRAACEGDTLANGWNEGQATEEGEEEDEKGPRSAEKIDRVEAPQRRRANRDRTGDHRRRGQPNRNLVRVAE